MLSLSSLAKAHPRQCCTRTLLAAASAIWAVVFIVPFCLPAVLPAGRQWQAVLSPQHPCPCKVLMPFPLPLPLFFPVSCFPAGRGGLAEAGNGFAGWKRLGGPQAQKTMLAQGQLWMEGLGTDWKLGGF